MKRLVARIKAAIIDWWIVADPDPQPSRLDRADGRKPREFAAGGKIPDACTECGDPACIVCTQTPTDSALGQGRDSGSAPRHPRGGWSRVDQLPEGTTTGKAGGLDRAHPGHQQTAAPSGDAAVVKRELDMMDSWPAWSGSDCSRCRDCICHGDSDGAA